MYCGDNWVCLGGVVSIDSGYLVSMILVSVKAGEDHS